MSMKRFLIGLSICLLSICIITIPFILAIGAVDTTEHDIEENKLMILYKVGNNDETMVVDDSEVLDYTINYEWSIEPTTLMYAPDGWTSWILNSEVSKYEEMGWSVNPIAIFTYDVFTKSNLSAEQIDKMLIGTGLAGYGSIIKDVETTCNVNAMVIIGIACHESHNGTSYAFRTKNNAFGLGPGMYFNSIESSIRYFGNLMNNKLYYGKSLEQINKSYCPGDGGIWTTKVKAHMVEKWNRL